MAFFASGRVWERDIVDPIKLSGHREFKWPDGTKYIGDWHNNLQHGQGVYTFPDGTQYVGLWHEGIPHGHGARSYRDGSSYEGDFFTGKRHGNGRLVYPNGDIYEGAFRDDLPWGKGVVISRQKKGVPVTKLYGSWKGTEFLVTSRRSGSEPPPPEVKPHAESEPKPEVAPLLAPTEMLASGSSKPSKAKQEMQAKMGQGMQFLLEKRYPQHSDDMLPVAWSVTWPVLNWIDGQIDSFAGKFRQKAEAKRMDAHYEQSLAAAMPPTDEFQMPQPPWDFEQPYVSGSTEQWNVLRRSALPDAELRQIWESSDVDKDGLLDFDEFKVALYQVKLKLDGKPLRNPTLSDPVASNENELQQAVSSSMIGMSAKSFDSYIKQLSNETVRKYGTDEFLQTVEELQKGVVQGTDPASFRQIYDSLIHNTRQSIEKMRGSLASLWDQYDVQQVGALDAKYFEPLLVRFFEIQRTFLSNQIYQQLNGLLPLFESPNISDQHRKWLNSIVRHVVDKEVLPAVVTVIERISEDMKRNLPTFRTELLKIIRMHMNSSASDQVIEKRQFISALSTAYKHLATLVGETIADRSLELIVTTLAVAHLAEKGQTGILPVQ